MADASWTWMIYLATHNNAAEVGEESVARIRAVAPNKDVRVLVQQSTLDHTTRHVIGASPEIAADLGQIDSGAPETLLDFIRWAAKTAPARRYALVLWSHGSGWAPSEMERVAQQQPAAVPVTAGELKQRGEGDTAGQIFFSSSLGELLAQPTPSERAIAFDDGSGHSLDTIELGRAIAKAAQALGRPLDLVGMNACQMSSAEVAYQLRGSAEVYVASQEDMPVQGWPYDDILPRVAAQPGMDAAALGTLVVERYLAYFQASQLPCQLYDLASFCRALAADGATPATAAANAVLAALADPTLMLKCAHLGTDYDDTGGLTTYLLPPGTGKPISPYYAETAYAQATKWGEFLAAYHAAVG